MHLRTLIAGTTLVVVGIAAAADASVGVLRSSHYSNAAAALEATWTHDQQIGVPANSLAPLRADLASRAPRGGWWSPVWWQGDGSSLVGGLQSRTDAVLQSALAADRAQAQAAIDEWSALLEQQTTWVDATASQTAATWPAQLKAAPTPLSLTELATQWHAFTQQQRLAVQAAQQAKLNEEMAAAGGAQAVLDTATRLVKTAAADNLDDGGVGALAAQLQAALTANTDPTHAGQQLLVAVDALQSLVNLNNQVAGEMRPLLLAVDQVRAEATTNASALAAQYQTVSDTFTAARSADQINAVAPQATALQAALQAEISANACGHAVPGGRVITVSLTLQEMLFFQDGCVVQATPITTGRPALPTPTGTFAIFQKLSPITFVSTSAPGTQYWYPTTKAGYGMQFAGGGYYIHDWPYESANGYGPGSEFNINSASHGCIHVPPSVMSWAFSWTPMGTPVIISG